MERRCFLKILSVAPFVSPFDLIQKKKQVPLQVSFKLSKDSWDKIDEGIKKYFQKEGERIRQEILKKSPITICLSNREYFNITTPSICEG